MRFDKTRNASKNIVFGIILKVYHIIVPFLMRTAMIYLLGVQYVGLDGLFASILSVLNLAELGVGSAMIYSMYKPIAEDDSKTICALMRLYKIYYRIIGLIVLCGGLILCPYIPKLISGDVPDGLNVYVLYLLNLAATVLSYWLFAYKSCLLQAHQRSDVISKITLIAHTVRYLLQLVFLFAFKNYYYYLIVALVTQLLINIFTAVVADRLFPQYKAVGVLPKPVKDGINRKIKDLFTAKIGAVIVDSVDTIVISAFLGLSILGIYQNYFYIVTALTGIINIVMTSCMAGIGNSLVTENENKVFGDFKTFNFIISWIAGFCTAALLVLYQPFMNLWVGSENMFDFGAVICFSAYFCIKQFNTLLNVYKDAAGIWHKDRYRPLVTALSNLAMNLIMVQFWGIYGVLLSTIISMLFIGMPWIINNLFTELFSKNKMLEFLKQIFAYILVIVLLCGVSYLVCSFIDFGGILGIAIRLVLVAVIFNIVYLIIFFKSKEFKNVLKIANRLTRGKISLLNRMANN